MQIDTSSDFLAGPLPGERCGQHAELCGRWPLRPPSRSPWREEAAPAPIDVEACRVQPALQNPAG